VSERLESYEPRATTYPSKLNGLLHGSQTHVIELERTAPRARAIVPEQTYPVLLRTARNGARALGGYLAPSVTLIEEVEILKRRKDSLYPLAMEAKGLPTAAGIYPITRHDDHSISVDPIAVSAVRAATLVGTGACDVLDVKQSAAYAAANNLLAALSVSARASRYLVASSEPNKQLAFVAIVPDKE
jgi:hypothetical protein